MCFDLLFWFWGSGWRRRVFGDFEIVFFSKCEGELLVWIWSDFGDICFVWDFVGFRWNEDWCVRCDYMDVIVGF